MGGPSSPCHRSSGAGRRAALGTELPGDYKQLCQAFGVGEFSQELSVLCADETRVQDLLRTWRYLLESDDSSDGPFAPYRIHEPGTTGGLIPWGGSRSGDWFFWQVTDGAVDAWPVLAMQVDSQEWNRGRHGRSEGCRPTMTRERGPQ
ncbi:SMI1/KNR4 family protein [Streptomyces mirabilis]|uniref:SMI1/KNR4 family protein n=1 Tax=Streptomyces mirabilis TaxID=68239 RepID=UPI0036470A5F